MGCVGWVALDGLRRMGCVGWVALDGLRRMGCVGWVAVQWGACARLACTICGMRLKLARMIGTIPAI